jgi:hypothetical protein
MGNILQSDLTLPLVPAIIDGAKLWVDAVSEHLWQCSEETITGNSTA